MCIQLKVQKSEVKWSENQLKGSKMKWSEGKWSEVKWNEVNWSVGKGERGRKSGALWGKVYVSRKKKKLRCEGLGLNGEWNMSGKTY